MNDVTLVLCISRFYVFYSIYSTWYIAKKRNDSFPDGSFVSFITSTQYGGSPCSSVCVCVRQIVCLIRVKVVDLGRKKKCFLIRIENDLPLKARRNMKQSTASFVVGMRNDRKKNLSCMRWSSFDRYARTSSGRRVEYFCSAAQTAELFALYS